MATPEEKRRLALSSSWPVEAIEEYFDIDGAEALRRASTAGQVNRFELERQLQYDGLVSLGWLALKFGVTASSLAAAMGEPPSGVPPFLLDGFRQGDHFLLPEKVADAWIKQYLLPRHKTWGSLDSRARDLASAIRGDVRECAVSIRFGETPPAVATCKCIVTWDDVSRAHQEYLDNAKPMSLEPDHVGWHALNDGFDPAQLFRSDLGNMQQYVERHADGG